MGKDCGVYSLVNIFNNRRYIGGSSNMYARVKAHLSMLSRGRHSNKELQGVYDRYGANVFRWEVLERCSKEGLLEAEQRHIDSYNFSDLYNLSTDVYKAGSDVQKIPTLILNLKGEVLSRHESVMSALSELGWTSYRRNTKISNPSIRKCKISGRKVRIVSEDFYNNNIEEVLSWRPYSCYVTWRSNFRDRFIVYNENDSYEFSSREKAARFLGLSSERVRQLIKSGKGTTGKRGPKTRYYIKKVSIDSNRY